MFAVAERLELLRAITGELAERPGRRVRGAAGRLLPRAGHRRDREGSARGVGLRLRAADGADEPRPDRASTPCSCRPAPAYSFVSSSLVKQVADLRRRRVAPAAAAGRRGAAGDKLAGPTDRRTRPRPRHAAPIRPRPGVLRPVVPAPAIARLGRHRSRRGRRQVEHRRFHRVPGIRGPRRAGHHRRRGPRPADDGVLRGPAGRRPGAARRRAGRPARRGGRRPGRAGPPRPDDRRRERAGHPDGGRGAGRGGAARRHRPRRRRRRRSPAPGQRRTGWSRTRPRMPSRWSPRAQDEAARIAQIAQEQHDSLLARAHAEAERAVAAGRASYEGAVADGRAEQARLVASDRGGAGRRTRSPRGSWTPRTPMRTGCARSATATSTRTLGHLEETLTTTLRTIGRGRTALRSGGVADYRD